MIKRCKKINDGLDDNMDRVIVTGGTGFIGSWLVDKLINEGIEVIMLVRDLEKVLKNPENIHPLKKIVPYYSAEYKKLCEEDNKIDVFYHLAWEGVSTKLKNECELQLNNIRFSLEMLELAQILKVQRFIATGTVAEYAFSEDIINVNGRQTPNDMYGAAKIAAHYMMETRARNLNIPFNWVVIPSTFGEGRREDNIITYTITSLLKGQRPQYGNLLQMWDFLYVKEVARALYLIAKKGKTDVTYGIGSGIFKPLKNYIMQIRDIINPELDLGIGEIPSFSEKTFSSCVSIYDITKDTGFVPEVTFEEGIQRTIAYYEKVLKVGVQA